MTARIVKAEPWHADAIASNPRPADVAELWASSRTTPAEAMRRGMAASGDCYTGLFDDVPVCMFGAAPLSILGGQAAAWMIGSAALDRLRVQKALLVLSFPVVDYLSQQYPALLYNFVDARNTTAIRWLRWLGFRFDPPIPYGVDQIPFLPFYIRRPEG